ncbi:MAG TPA: thioredoxin domain-containing protein [Candidatus Saccharimonadales bacterium]|nr:thioredoxin domain-containing protein [Candidatus Saccharimonadales bacterium]
MDRRFWIIIGVIIAVFVGIFLWSGNKESKEEDTSTAGQATNHIRGKQDSRVKLVEYSDFQCPYCGQYYPIVEQVVEKYKDKISYQYRHYPLSQLHGNAISAARASEAASAQGKFWEMYHLIFKNQQSWSEVDNSRTVFEGYATEIGLDIAKFREDYASSKANDSINADKREFNALKLPKSTPTFLLNGKKIQPVSVDEFSKLIDAELKKQGQ